MADDDKTNKKKEEHHHHHDDDDDDDEDSTLDLTEQTIPNNNNNTARFSSALFSVTGSPSSPPDEEQGVILLVVEEDKDNKSNNKEQGEKETEEEIISTTLSLSCCRKMYPRAVKFWWDNEFVCLVVVVILLARAYPPLGAVYLAPDITSTWIAVIFIFIMAGLGLKTEEFSKAFQRLWFNTVVQVFNFGVVSSVVFGVSRALVQINVISQSLADGMVVCAALPLTINMVLVLTKSAGGDEASAIFNAAFGNMVGVFLSPLLILGYLGVSDSGSVELWEVFYKLALRVVAPVTLGQLLQKFCPPVVAFTKKYKHHFKQAQQYCLIFIVYTVFCETFYAAAAADDDDNAVDTTSIGDIFIMIAVQFCLLCGLMILSWYTFRCFFRDEPTLRVMGLFGSTQKTVAMGVPLINAIYQGNPLIGLYTLPLLIWHPMQLVVGTFLAPKLAKWVEQEQERLGQQGQQEQQQPQAQDDDHDDDDVGDEGANGEVAKKDSEDDDEEEAGTKAASGSSDEEAPPPSPTASAAAAAAAAAETTTTSNNNE